MPSNNKLQITLYPIVAAAPHDHLDQERTDGVHFEDVDYLSFINGDTFGKPPLITGDDRVRDDLPITVLYVSTGNVSAIEVTRES